MAGLLAFCSISYELLVTRTIIMVAADNVLWQSVTIGIYVAALGIGAYLFTVLKKTNLPRFLFKAEIALSICGGLCVLAVFFLHTLYRIYLYRFFGEANFSQAWNHGFLMTTIVAAQGITLVIGILSGFEVPVLIEMMKEHSPHRDPSGRVLAANYLGTLLGTLVFSLYLLPALDVFITAVVVAALNLAVCLYLLWSRGSIPRRAGSMAVTVGAGVLAIVLLVTPVFYRNYLKNLYYNFPNKNRVGLTGLPAFLASKPDVRRIRTRYQYIDLVKNQFADHADRYEMFAEFKGKEHHTLFLDRHLQFETLHEAYYHEAMVHVPIMLTRKVPRRVLVLGGGDGMVARELLKYGDRIEKITQVELDERVGRLAVNDPLFAGLNQNSLKHPRVKLLLEDAFYFVRNSREKYDAIFVDFPYPYNYDLARLYSTEFYRFVRERLNPDGFITLDFPLFEKAEHLRFNDVIFSTLWSAGFNQLLGYEVSESFIFARPRKRAVDFRFHDMGVNYKILTPEIMRSIAGNPFTYRLDKKKANSVFRPGLFGLSGSEQFF